MQYYVTLAFHVVVAVQSMSEMRLILNLARCILELRANKKSPVSTRCASYRVCSQVEKISKKLVNRRASGSHQQRYLSLPFLFGVLSGRGEKTRAEGKQTRCSIISLEFGPATFFVPAASRDIINQPPPTFISLSP